MNKFTKTFGGLSLLGGVAYLIHKKAFQNHFKSLKSSIHDFHQLSNRLGKQLRSTKRNAINFTKAFRKINSKQIKDQLNNFDQRTLPKISRIQATTKQMKQDSSRN